MELPQTENYRQLFLDRTPLLDVRAPVEFHQGAFPGATNFPLLNDDERKAIGVRYKEEGQKEAVNLGHQLIRGHIKQARVNQWVKFAETNPEGALYCFRGGLRSRISQQWLYDTTGVIYPRVKGGYKALRRFLITELEQGVEATTPLILSGRTGVGKTLLLDKLSQKIDLEDIYNHRGSAFGRHVSDQPSQIDIENQLAISLLRFRHQGIKDILIEDEAANIGSRRIPENLFDKMRSSPVLVLEEELDRRVDIVFEEYIVRGLQEFRNALGEEEGFAGWAELMRQSFNKIKKRLGGLRYDRFVGLLTDALGEHQRVGDASAHKNWIQSLLIEYYDPMYDYQLSKKTDRLLFRGTRDEIETFLNNRYSPE